MMSSNEWLTQTRTDLEAMIEDANYRLSVARKYLYMICDFKRTYDPLKQLRDHLEWAREAASNIADIDNIDRAIEEGESRKYPSPHGRVHSSATLPTC